MKPRHSSAGFSLVELMVAMVISLLLSAAAISLFVSNKRVYAATEGIGRIQENARMSFELMARDIRGAGGVPCDVRMNVVNVLADTANWWAIYDAGIRGFDNGGLPGSTAGTDAIRIQYFEDTGIVTTADMTPGDSGPLPVQDVTRFDARQILMACGFFDPAFAPVTSRAAIFSAGKAGGALTHLAADGNTQGYFTNATYPGNVKFLAGTLLGKLRAMEWYVAANDHGGTSLFRRHLNNAGAPGMSDAEEIIDGVTNLQLTYLEGGAWTTGLAGNWANVTAVQVELDLEARDSRAGGVQDELIKRRQVNVIALRNKL